MLTFLELLKGVLSTLGPYYGEATIESKSSSACLSVLYCFVAAYVPAVITLLKFKNSFFNPPFYKPPLMLFPLVDLGLDLDLLEEAFFFEGALFYDFFLTSSFSCDLFVSKTLLALAPRLLNGL